MTIIGASGRCWKYPPPSGKVFHKAIPAGGRSEGAWVRFVARALEEERGRHKQKTPKRIGRGRKRRLASMQVNLTRSFPKGKQTFRLPYGCYPRNDKVLRKLSRARKSRARVALKESPRMRPISS